MVSSRQPYSRNNRLTNLDDIQAEYTRNSVQVNMLINQIKISFYEKLHIIKALSLEIFECSHFYTSFYTRFNFYAM